MQGKIMIEGQSEAHGGMVIGARLCDAARQRSARRMCLAASLLATLVAMSGCTGPEGSPVLGAVFGLEDAAQAPFRVGTIPDPVVRPGDRVVGQAANNPGQCIYLRGNMRRFRANCPEGYEL